MTTYQDAFAYANGDLTGRVGGFGTWAVQFPPVPPNICHTFQVSSGNLTLRNPSTPSDPGQGGNQNTVSSIAGPLAIPAYTKSADLSFDITLGTYDSSYIATLDFQQAGTFTGFFLGFDYGGLAGSGGGHFWDLAGGNGFLSYDDADPPGMAPDSSFRFGVYHDVLTDTVRLYSEPHGGGTRTWIGAPQDNLGGSFAGDVSRYIYFNALFDTTIGSLDAITLVTANVTTPASVTVSPSVAVVGQAAQQQFTASVLDTNGQTISGDTITWTSSDTASASVSASGLASAPVASFNSTVVTITASDGTYASGTASLYLGFSNVAVFQRAPWYTRNIGYYYSPQVIESWGGQGWTPGTNSFATSGPQIAVLTVQSSASTAPVYVVLQEYRDGSLLSSQTAFTNPAWSSTSTYLLGLFWDGQSSLVTPYFVISGSTTTGTAMSVSSNWAVTWNPLDYLGGIGRPSTASVDRLGLFLRNAPSGTSFQPYYIL